MKDKRIIALIISIVIILLIVGIVIYIQKSQSKKDNNIYAQTKDGEE